MIRSFFFLLFFLFFGCSSSPKEIIRIGIDPSFYPLQLGEQEIHVRGFLEEFLLELSKVLSIEIEKVRGNFDSLLSELEKTERKYDVVVSSLLPQNFYEGKYLFSPIFLDTGLVVILPKGSGLRSWQEMAGKRVGSVEGAEFLQTKEGVFVRFYDQIAIACNALVEGKIDGVLAPVLQAVYYEQNLYPGLLQMSFPQTEEGLRFVTLTKDERIQKKLTKGLKVLEKKGVIQKLKEKWGLVEKQEFKFS